MSKFNRRQQHITLKPSIRLRLKCRQGSGMGRECFPPSSAARTAASAGVILAAGRRQQDAEDPENFEAPCDSPGAPDQVSLMHGQISLDSARACRGFAVLRRDGIRKRVNGIRNTEYVQTVGGMTPALYHNPIRPATRALLRPTCFRFAYSAILCYSMPLLFSVARWNRVGRLTVTFGSAPSRLAQTELSILFSSRQESVRQNGHARQDPRLRGLQQ